MKKSECSLSVFFEIGLAGGAQLVVPFLAEAARQRIKISKFQIRSKIGSQFCTIQTDREISR